MTQPQVNAEKPSFSDVMGNFTDSLSHPLTLNEGEAPNWAGAIMLGLGTGLTTWVLSRLFGVKSGPSFAFSILGALAGGHFALGQQYGDYNYFNRLGGNKPAPTPEPAPEPTPAEAPVETQAQSPVDKLNDTRFRWSTQGATEADINKMLNQGSFYDRASDKMIPLTPDQVDRLEQRREEMKELRYFGKRIDDMTYDDIQRNGGEMMGKLVEGEFDNFRGLTNPEDVGIKTGPDGRIDPSDMMRYMAGTGNPVYDKLMKKWDSLSSEQKGNMEDERIRAGLEPPAAQTPTAVQTPVQAQPVQPPAEPPVNVQSAPEPFEAHAPLPNENMEGFNSVVNAPGNTHPVPVPESATGGLPTPMPQAPGPRRVSFDEARQNFRNFGNFWRNAIHDARSGGRDVRPAIPPTMRPAPGAFFQMPQANPKADPANRPPLGMIGDSVLEPERNSVLEPRRNSILDWRNSVLDVGEDARQQGILKAIMGQ